MEHIVFKKRIATDFKINLSLDILPKRADAYHGIDSLFMRLSGGDNLALQVSLPLEQQMLRHNQLPQVSLQDLLSYTQLLSNWDLDSTNYVCYASGGDEDLLSFLNHNKEKNLVYKSAAYCLAYLQLALLKRLFQFNSAIMTDISTKINWSLNQTTISKLLKKLQVLSLPQLLKCIADFVNFRWQFYLEKNLPTQAGLGAGSYDAAAVWRLILDCLNTCWQLDLAYKDFVALFDPLEIAKNIGADTVFALQDSIVLARVMGIGEQLKPLAVDSDGFMRQKLYFIIVQPEWRVDTAAAYGLFDASKEALASSNIAEGLRLLKYKQYDSLYKQLFNHFSTLLLTKQELYQSFLNYLKHLTEAEYINLSGSGSACFLLYSDVSKRNADYTYLSKNLTGGNKLFVAESPYFAWLD